MGLEKRGLSKVGTTLIIILIVLVAAILIYSFSREKEEESSPVSEQCASLCETNQSSAFCTFKVSASDTLRVTCNELLTNPQYSNYNVQACPTISCSQQQVNDQACAGLGGIWTNPSSSETCPAQEGKLVRKRTPSDSPPSAGQICCYYYE